MNDLSYNRWDSMSDKALTETIGHFIKSQRLLQNKSQDQVATDAGISRSTLSLLEKGETIRIDSLIRVLRVLNLLYILDVFTVKDQISPIEYAKLKKKQRKQASPKQSNANLSKESEW
ncbi:MAG: helix-turn-helix domain-containing protein [Saprospiraceae bacterium]|nr:helix-turn-helix domain-containing protein [Saprospiraceae bacterium]